MSSATFRAVVSSGLTTSLSPWAINVGTATARGSARKSPRAMARMQSMVAFGEGRHELRNDPFGHRR